MDAPTDSSSGSGKKIRLTIVTNIPTPYRTPVFEALARNPLTDLTVVFFSRIEPDRHWAIKEFDFDARFLKQRFVTINGRFIHFNLDVWSELRKIKPDVVITTGFNPSHLIAFAYAKLFGLPHIAMTDGTRQSEEGLTFVHRWIRRRVFASSSAFLAASEGGFDIFRSYGIPDKAMFKSHLCADNDAYAKGMGEQKHYDFLFVGRFTDIKNPLLALDIASGVSESLGRQVSIAFAGSGPLEDDMREHSRMLEKSVRTTFLGFSQKDELPLHYARARIFLFPSSWDPWGVVANEACAAGVPVIVSPHAGVAGELVVDGDNGFVRALDKQAWITAACELLTNQPLYKRMSERAMIRVLKYSFVNAAIGIADAVAFASKTFP